MIIQLPRQIGSLEVLERLGEGGMAVVHRARDRFRPERPLALKFLKPESARDPEVVRRFLREGEVLEHLSHPALVEVHEHGRAGSTPYLLMELLGGGSVRACMGEAPSRIVARLVPVADALAYAHAHGVVHRDLKPSNLLFSLEGVLKVTDFGVCLWEGAEGSRATQSRMVVGTLGYMAPEQHGDPRKVDGRCDVYALGAVLYEFTTGQPWAQVQVPPSSARPGFPVRLSSILVRALAADPQRRIPSMIQFRDELAEWLDRAEAAGWGAEPLPGFAPEIQEAATLARAKGEPEPSEVRLHNYLEALRTGAVGVRRGAAEGLLSMAIAEDEAYLLSLLRTWPQEVRFALVQALGRIGSEASMQVLASFLDDPFAHREAAEALSLVALRCGQADVALQALREPGIGRPGRWIPRARLGDVAWVEALAESWTSLTPPLRVQSLEAAAGLPAPLREHLKPRLEPFLRGESPALKRSWETL